MLGSHLLLVAPHSTASPLSMPHRPDAFAMPMDTSNDAPPGPDVVRYALAALNACFEVASGGSGRDATALSFRSELQSDAMAAQALCEATGGGNVLDLVLRWLDWGGSSSGAAVPGGSNAESSTGGGGDTQPQHLESISWESFMQSLLAAMERCPSATPYLHAWRSALAPPDPPQAVAQRVEEEYRARVSDSMERYRRQLQSKVPEEYSRNGGDSYSGYGFRGLSAQQLRESEAERRYYAEQRAFEASQADKSSEMQRLEEQLQQMVIQRQQGLAAARAEQVQAGSLPITRVTPLEASAAVEARMAAAEAAAAAQPSPTEVRLAARMQPLTADQETTVEAAFKGGQDDIVAETHAATLTRGSLQRIRGLNWLNDEVINMYMQLLLQRDKRLCQEDPQRRASHIFNSYFLSKLTENSYTYSNVRRWTKKAKVDVFELDKVIMPANVGNMHWCLVVVYVQQRRIQYYDSMAGPGTVFLNALERWIEDEHKDKKGKPLGATWTKVPTIEESTPQQENGCDCGVFTCMFADYISESLPLSFSQQHMQHFRRRIAYQLLNGKAF